MYIYSYNNYVGHVPSEVLISCFLIVHMLYYKCCYILRTKYCGYSLLQY